MTRVPVDKVTYVAHDPEDMCYFGVIIQTKESHTGFRLYCFKAEKPMVSTCMAHVLLLCLKLVCKVITKFYAYMYMYFIFIELFHSFHFNHF